MDTPGSKSEHAINRNEERDLRRLWRRGTRDFDVGMRYAQLLRDNKKYDKAFRILAETALGCIDRGDLGGAITVLKTLDGTPPGDETLRHNLAAIAVNTGQACEAQGDIDNALHAYLVATRINPGMPEAHNEYAALNFRLKDYELSEQQYRKVLAAYPANDAALTGLAALLSITGRYAEGLDLLTPELAANNPALLLLRSRLLGGAGETRRAIDLLDNLLDDVDIDNEYRASAFINLGKLYDATNRFDLAMSCFVDGKALKKNSFDPVWHTGLMDTIIDVYAKESLSELSRAEPGRYVPLFIVGMPRSGTTLAEQLLAGCENVLAGGERDDMIAAALSFGGPGNGNDQWPRTMNAVREQELARIADGYCAGCPQGVRVLTDKMPPNFLFIGLIWQLFPNARIVHCTRNPMDTALSCFFQDFSSPLFDFCHDIAHLGLYFEQYKRLMQHWQETLDLPIFDLSYEEMVTEPKATGRRLFDFAGLEWNDAYLDLRAVDRVINTASYDQVRKPIYSSSIRRHEKYAMHLGPFRRAGFG